LTITFKPDTAGAKNAAFSIGHNASGSPNIVTLAGIGIAPIIAIDSPLVDFGSVTVGNYVNKTITISNMGSADLKITALSFTGVDSSLFTFSPANTLPITVTPSNSTTVTVRFTPTTTKSDSAMLRIVHNATGSPSLVQLVGSGVVIAPVILIEPASLDFGDVDIDTFLTKKIKIKNIGNADLRIDSLGFGKFVGGNTTLFNFDTLVITPITIVAGDSNIFKIRFVPGGVVGAKSAELTIRHNAAGYTSIVPLTGIGTAAPFIVIDTPSINFGRIYVGDIGQGTLKIRNIGNADLIISTVSLGGVDGSLFTVDTSVVSRLPIVVPARWGSTELAVNFIPKEGRDVSATFSVIHNAVGSPSTVQLVGTGLGAGVKMISSIDFGDVMVDSPKIINVTVTNIGNINLIISDITFVGGDGSLFTLTNSPLPMVVPPSDSTVFRVRFLPSYAGFSTTTIRMLSNAPTSPTIVPIGGNGIRIPVIRVSPSPLDFSNVLVDSMVFRTIKIVNRGSADLVISALGISGPDAGLFTYSGPAWPRNILPSDSAVYTIRFLTNSTGPKTAQFNIAHNDNNVVDPYPNTSAILLTANGVSSYYGVDVSPLSIDFGPVSVGLQIDSAIYITNTGILPITVNEINIKGRDL